MNVKWLTDKKKACQAYQKVKKIHALTRKNTCQPQKKPAVTGWSFLLLTSILLVSGIENKDFPEKNSNFIV